MAIYIIDIPEEDAKALTFLLENHACSKAYFEELISNATPLEEEFEWCHDCKEYDTEKHCCHRWSKIIRNTLKDNINAVLEDIKAEIENQANQHWIQHGVNMDWNYCYSIIDKHISGKE